MNLKIIRDAIYSIPVSKPLQEFFLETIRLVFIAGVSMLLVYGAAKANVLPSEYQVYALTFLISMWKALDKFKFETNKEQGVRGETNFGLVGM